MDSFHPLLILPEELWKQIIFNLDLCSLAYLSLTCSYFYDAVGKRFNQEYNTILYRKDKVVVSFINYYSKYKSMSCDKGMIFSCDNIVLLYHHIIHDIAGPPFRPFITSIRSSQELRDTLNRIGNIKELREDYLDPNISFDDIFLEMAKKSAIEGIVSALYEIRKRVNEESCKFIIKWGLHTHTMGKTAEICLRMYPDMVALIEKKIRKSYSDFRIKFSQYDTIFRFGKGPFGLSHYFYV